MRVTMIGSGKLGFPVGCAMAAAGHEVVLNDSNSEWLERLKRGELPPNEAGLQELYNNVREDLEYSDQVQQAVIDSDIIFVAVQTPHAPVPQPLFVPMSPNSSRITSRSNCCGETEMSYWILFMLRDMVFFNASFSLIFLHLIHMFHMQVFRFVI